MTRGREIQKVNCHRIQTFFLDFLNSLLDFFEGAPNLFAMLGIGRVIKLFDKVGRLRNTVTVYFLNRLTNKLSKTPGPWPGLAINFPDINLYMLQSRHVALGHTHHINSRVPVGGRAGG
jgi:hypothetical protein|tara:strand:+ start:456 stop:812 length:357 start_codon:yes stop_codon:yes gene_type:complete